MKGLTFRSGGNLVGAGGGDRHPPPPPPLRKIDEFSEILP
jgi:hypothetical protein